MRAQGRWLSVLEPCWCEGFGTTWKNLAKSLATINEYRISGPALGSFWGLGRLWGLLGALGADLGRLGPKMAEIWAIRPAWHGDGKRLDFQSAIDRWLARSFSLSPRVEVLLQHLGSILGAL